MDSKKWYTSKTLWANSIALIAIIVQVATGKEILSLEVQTTILSVVNIILRLVTKSQVTW